MKRLFTCLALLCGLSAGCARQTPPPPSSIVLSPAVHSSTTVRATTAAKTTAKTFGINRAAPLAPDPAKTPGDVLPVTPADFCVTGYTKKVRDVPESVKKKVYAAYGITHHAPREYEVDHLISLELGGSNSIRNLWPESYMTRPWNARVKDVLENKLHALICDGKLDMKTAQREIATDWIAAYKKYVRPNPEAKP